MSDLYEEERINEKAMRELIAKHRDEYDALVGAAAERRIAQLEREVYLANVALGEVRAMNPNGTNVTALEMTVEGLAAHSDHLERELIKERKKNERLQKQLDLFKKAVREAS
jgi:hypothetical protein